jgi:hypothetical protein
VIVSSRPPQAAASQWKSRQQLRRSLTASAPAPTIRWLRPALYVSPFFYIVEQTPARTAAYLASMLIVTASSSAFAAVASFNRLDVH